MIRRHSMPSPSPRSAACDRAAAVRQPALGRERVERAAGGLALDRARLGEALAASGAPFGGVCEDDRVAELGGRARGPAVDATAEDQAAADARADGEHHDRLGEQPGRPPRAPPRARRPTHRCRRGPGCSVVLPRMSRSGTCWSGMFTDDIAMPRAASMTLGIPRPTASASPAPRSPRRAGPRGRRGTPSRSGACAPRRGRRPGATPRRPWCRRRPRRSPSPCSGAFQMPSASRRRRSVAGAGRCARSAWMRAAAAHHVARPRAPSGERVLHDAGHLLRRDRLARRALGRLARAVAGPWVALAQLGDSSASTSSWVSLALAPDLGRDRPGLDQRDVDPLPAQLEPQRVREGVHGELRRRVGRRGTAAPGARRSTRCSRSGPSRRAARGSARACIAMCPKRLTSN